MVLRIILYEKQILNAPFANQDDPHAEFTNGVLIHQHNQALPVALSSPEDLKPFSFLNEVYKTLQNREMLNIFLTSLNMSEEYKKRFTEALIVSSVGILARDNGTTEAEKADLAPYKMVDPQSSRHLFDVFSVLVNENTVSDIDRLVNPNATLTDTHFAQICQAFPSITADHQVHLVFALAAFFVISSAQPFFGTADDSPIAIRFYVNALINKLHTLNPSLFNQINGDYIKGELLKDSCTDSLSSSMRASAKSDPLLKEIYERVVPKMWQ